MFLMLLFNPLAAQSLKKPISLSHYVFSDFIQGDVLKKTGAKEKALLNYNSLTEQMIFDQNGTRLALTQLFTIDTVYIANRKFIPVDSMFYEVLSSRSSISLYVKHKCSVSIPGTSIGYGMNTTTSSATPVSRLPLGQGGAAYDLHLPDNYKINPQTKFFLKQLNDGLIEIRGVKQLSKVFPQKSQLIKNFADKNHVDFTDQDALIELLNFIFQYSP
jgi:hypothetical protein